MPPEILAGSYKRYKEDTNVFTTWLSQAAVACGYQAKQEKVHEKPQLNMTQAISVTPRLKGKARKEAKAAAAEIKKPTLVDEPSPPIVKYNVTTQELLNQAEAVA